MKKIILTIAVMMAMTVSSFAQSKNIEPEYIGQVVILNADSTTVLLQKEAASMKAKSSNWGLLPIPGSGMLDKAKTKLTIKGKEAPVSVPAGKVVLIIKAASNEQEPNKVFGVMKFEVEKKARTFLVGEYSLVGGVDATMNYSNVPFVAKKYGNNCYIITIENAEPGEYAVNTDFSQMSTFSVK